MSKKKNKTQREDLYDMDSFDDIEDRFSYIEDGEVDEDDDEDWSVEERRARFDVNRWRDDLFERGRHREQMRQRDLNRGILPGNRIPADFAFAEEEEEEEE